SIIRPGGAIANGGHGQRAGGRRRLRAVAHGTDSGRGGGRPGGGQDAQVLHRQCRGRPMSAGSTYAAGSAQLGQALVLAMLLMAAALLVLVRYFSVGQVIAAKS